MFTNPFIGIQIRSLIHELTLLSGKQFREECYLFPEEELGPDKRIDLALLVHGKVSVVKSFHELLTSLHGIEQFLLYNHQVAPGYERVAEKYHELLMQRWIIAADKYKKGYDPDPNLDFRTWAYGLIEVDQTLLGEFRSVLQETEKAIKDAPPPDFGDPFKLGYLTNDLMKAGVPTSGLSLLQKSLVPEDATIFQGYFKLKDGRYIRITMPENTDLTDEQREIAHKMILEHEKTMEVQSKVCEAVRLGLVRDGHKISGLRFNRSEDELTFDPEKFVSLDTEIGVLEIRTRQPLEIDQREQMRRTAKERLDSYGIKAFIPPTLDDTRHAVAGFKNFIERQAYKDIFVNGNPQENIARSLLQAYLIPRSYREVPVRGGQTDILVFAGQGKFLFETKIWRGYEYYKQGLREIEEYVIGEGDAPGLTGIFYIIFDPTKSHSAREHLGDDFASTQVCNRQVDIVIVNLLPPQPSKKA